jgi:hypothetical protein
LDLDLKYLAMLKKQRKTYLRDYTKSIPKSTAWRLKKRLGEPEVSATPIKRSIFEMFYLRFQNQLNETGRVCNWLGQVLREMV